MKEDWWLPVRRFAESGLKEMVVELSLPGKDYKRDGSLLFKDEPPVRFRLILVELENGQKEVLCSSLTDSAQYPHELFRELYHCRWGVEEGYKLLKERLDSEVFFSFLDFVNDSLPQHNHIL
jgi:IS4 transposase